MADHEASDRLLVLEEGPESQNRRLPVTIRRVGSHKASAACALATAFAVVVAFAARSALQRGSTDADLPARTLMRDEVKARERGMLVIGERLSSCFLQERAYYPIDMIGAIPLAAGTVAECQDRCSKLPGCRYFSFDHISMVCHLEDASAVLQEMPLPFISGPAECVPTSTNATSTSSSTATTRTTTTVSSTVTETTSTKSSSSSSSSSSTSTSATTTTLSTTSSPRATTTLTTLPLSTSTLSTSSPPKYRPSLFCFLMLMPTGYEPDLVRAQVSKWAGVFTCDQHTAFSVARIDLGSGLVTTKLGVNASQKGSWGSWLNTENFLEAWDSILAEGKFRRSDWTVKVDPDCVFFPDRLKLHLQQVFPSGPDGPFYIKNCPKSFGMMGSLEVLNTEAVDVYGKNRKECRSKYNPSNSGEDGYMQACLHGSGVAGEEDFSLLIDSYCGFGKCEGNTWNVGFHPYKDTDSWFTCWQQVVVAR
eukprot:CAMPEP_0171059374 /NCGR_PEP_ID=MMETSP0766_2-20121228/3141_1 /TAXON_ID=439317 /ORGANISM="Gambierdiscus australes, Strain CAWD 149" /LENGTH=477 /DNA_ID=CAMNT_0011514805 /DNA_START=42 /DNA_END=1475 /DNA_ORIENTATION=-